MKRILISVFFIVAFLNAKASFLLIPMDDTQKNHLKAYGIAYFALQNNLDVKWLLNYKGGSFLFGNTTTLEKEFVSKFAIILTYNNSSLSNTGPSLHALLFPVFVFTVHPKQAPIPHAIRLSSER